MFRLERHVFDEEEFGGMIGEDGDGEDVVLGSGVAEAILVEPGGGGAHDVAEFCFGDAAFGGTEAFRAAGFYFYKMIDAVENGDNIHFCSLEMPVAMEDRIAVAGEPGYGEVFAFCSKIYMCGSGHS